MNVYQLKVTGCYGGGMALVAAWSFEHAKNEYLCNGIYGEEYWLKYLVFDESLSQPITGLEWHGEQGVITESIYLE